MCVSLYTSIKLTMFPSLS